MLLLAQMALPAVGKHEGIRVSCMYNRKIRRDLILGIDPEREPETRPQRGPQPRQLNTPQN